MPRLSRKNSEDQSASKKRTRRDSSASPKRDADKSKYSNSNC